MPGRPHHTQKWQDCVADVQAKGKGNAFAICTANLGPSIESADMKMDDNDGSRGDVAPPADSFPAELPTASTPGSIKPKLQRADDKSEYAEMDSRCMACGVDMKAYDMENKHVKASHGTMCKECAEKRAYAEQAEGKKTEAQKATLDQVDAPEHGEDPDSNWQKAGSIERPDTKGGVKPKQPPSLRERFDESVDAITYRFGL